MNADVEQSPGGTLFASVSDSISVYEIVDANMNPIPGAFIKPVPEPSTLWLIWMGLTALVGCRKLNAQ